MGHIFLEIPFCRLLIETALISIGHSVISCYASPTILEMHGEVGISMVFGLENFGYGAGATVGPPLAGERFQTLS